MAKCPHNDAACGVYYDCGPCLRAKRKAIWDRMTPAQQAYDKHVDPAGWYTSGLSASSFGCSCHLSAPCSYCCDVEEEPA